MTRVLLVDDDASLRETLSLGLAADSFQVTTADSADQARRALEALELDVVVTDLAMRKETGIDLCRSIVAARADVPVIVLTAFGSVDTAVAAIRAGAYDFLQKPIELEALGIAIRRAAEHRRLGEEIRRLRQRVDESAPFTDIIGKSAAMVEALDLVARLAPTGTTVLITGESGTGKEVVAREIHRRSRRHDGPFVAVNCAAVPEALLESELFGYARGAFTDAKTSHDGLFARARGGTIFLDEVGDMPLSLQPKLLRVLEERVVRPLGGHEQAVDARVLAATNRDLESAVESGAFRSDLFYRINVVQIELPPLRARAADILPLAGHFIASLAHREQLAVSGISRGAAERLLAYSWPGNIRELRNCMERAVALARFEQISAEDLPDKVRDFRASHVVVSSEDPSELVSLEEVERRYIAHVMKSVGGNKSAAARVLGVDRKRLQRMLLRLEVGAD